MDTDYLIRREAEERLCAERAACDRSQAAHVMLADLYRGRIDSAGRLDRDRMGCRGIAAVPSAASPRAA